MHACDPTSVHSTRVEILLSRSPVVNAKEAALGHWLLAISFWLSALGLELRLYQRVPCGQSFNDSPDRFPSGFDEVLHCLGIPSASNHETKARAKSQD